MRDEIPLDESSVEFERQLGQLRPAKVAVNEQAIWFQAGRQSALRDAAAPKMNLRLGQLAWCSSASALAGAVLIAFIGSFWFQSNTASMGSLDRNNSPQATQSSPVDPEQIANDFPAFVKGQSDTTPAVFANRTSQATNRLLDTFFNNNDLQLRTIQDWQDVMNGRRTIASLVMTTGIPASRYDNDQDNTTSTIGSLYQEYFSSTQ